MKKQDNSNLYLADEGKTIRCKLDGMIMGTGIDLGVDDSIDNYEEVDLTEENDVEGILKRNKERMERRAKLQQNKPTKKAKTKQK